MKKIIFALSLILLVFCFIPRSYSYTSHPLDHILSYDIWVNTNNDASIDLEYSIKWKVLDSSTEGVTWVKIGVANKYCTNVVNLSSDIKKIGYRSMDGGTYVRCDMVKEFMAGEIIDIHFKCHQTHMFKIMEDKDNGTKLVTYKFTPGWFEEIEVDRLTIHWNKTNVYFDDAKSEDENYYIWETSLGQGERTSASVSYDIKEFPFIDENESYAGATDNRDRYFFFIIVSVIILVLLIICWVCKLLSGPSYYRTRGFYPMGRRFMFREYYYGVNDRGVRKVNPYVSSGGSGHHSGHSCACACACACAGGGRAGCSKKDFYKGNIKIEDVVDKLEA